LLSTCFRPDGGGAYQIIFRYRSQPLPAIHADCAQQADLAGVRGWSAAIRGVRGAAADPVSR
jgi:hypothetical protein